MSSPWSTSPVSGSPLPTTIGWGVLPAANALPVTVGWTPLTTPAANAIFTVNLTAGAGPLGLVASASTTTVVSMAAGAFVGLSTGASTAVTAGVSSVGNVGLFGSVTGFNLASNPSFENTSIYTWLGGAYSTVQAHSFTHSVLLTADHATYQAVAFTANTSAVTYTFVAPGQQVYAEVWVRGDSANTQTTGGFMGLAIDWNDSRGVNADSFSYTQVAASTASNGVWTKVTLTATCPAGYNQFFAYVQLEPNVNAGEKYYWDDPVIQFTPNASVNAQLTSRGGLAVPVSGSSGAGTLSATCAFPSTGAALTTFGSPGSYTYTIPWWCNKIDVILLGSGQSGRGSNGINTGRGGAGGSYVAVTLVRGTDIPWSTASITGTVGNFGTPGAGGGGSAGGSNPTTATGTGMTSQSAAGGTGESNASPNTWGDTPGNKVFDGQTYTGGGTANNQTGRGPGGGGAGGTFGGPGFNAAAGAAWFYAYQ